MTLYQLTDEYEKLLELAEDPDTDPDMLQDTLDALEGEIEEKADGYAVVMRELQGQSDLIDDEVKRLKARKAAVDGNINRMKENLRTAMEATGRTKFKTALFSFGIQANAPSVVLDAENVFDIPEVYLKYKEPDVDKVALRKDLQAGKDLAGVAHLEQTSSLRIR